LTNTPNAGILNHQVKNNPKELVMSAFVVSDFHINAIVGWASRKEVTAYHGNPTHAYSFAKEPNRMAEIL
jgi:hypothetical protein